MEAMAEPTPPGPGTAPAGGTPRWKIRSDQVAWEVLDDEVVILDLRQSLYWSLNDSAAALWQMLAEGATVDELVARIERGFGAPADVAVADVTAFVDSCLAQELLEAVA